MIFHIMVLYIYFDNEIMNETNMKVLYGKNPCQNENKCDLIFLDKLAEIVYNELIKNEEWLLVLDGIYFLY